MTFVESSNDTDFRLGMLFRLGAAPDTSDGGVGGGDAVKVDPSASVLVLAHVAGIIAFEVVPIAFVKNDPAPLSKQSCPQSALLSPITTRSHSS